MNEGPAFLGFNATHLGEGIMDVLSQDYLGAIRAADFNPGWIGIFRHNDFGANVQYGRRVADGDGVVAGAHGRHAARQLFSIDAQHIGQRSPGFEGAGMLE